MRPGNLLGQFILVATRETGCQKCETRAERMNRWGWLGCWKNRKIILRWLVKEATARGYTIRPRKQIHDLVRSAWSELAKHKSLDLLRKAKYRRRMKFRVSLVYEVDDAPDADAAEAIAKKGDGKIVHKQTQQIQQQQPPRLARPGARPAAPAPSGANQN